MSDQVTEWVDVGAADELSRAAVSEVVIGRTKLAITHADGVFGAISGACSWVSTSSARGTTGSSIA